MSKTSCMKFRVYRAALAWSAGMSIVFALSACAPAGAPPRPSEMSSESAYQEGVPGGIVVKTRTMNARVTAVDMGDRRATLMGPDGKRFTVKVGPEAVNFDQVRVGDNVKVTVTEELVVYLNEEGAAPRDASAGVIALAPKGAQPAGLLAETTRMTATVTAIDEAGHTATLRFEDGSTKTFPVRGDVDLTRRKVGEQVVFHVTEMIAVSVEKP